MHATIEKFLDTFHDVWGSLAAMAERAVSSLPSETSGTTSIADISHALSQLLSSTGCKSSSPPPPVHKDVRIIRAFSQVKWYTHFEKQLLHYPALALGNWIPSFVENPPCQAFSSSRCSHCTGASVWVILAGACQEVFGISLKPIICNKSATESRSSEKFCSFVKISHGLISPSIRIPTLQVQCCPPGLEFTNCSVDSSHPTYELRLYLHLLFLYAQYIAMKGGSQGPEARGPCSVFVWFICHCSIHPGLFQILGCCQKFPCTGKERWSQWYTDLYRRCFSIFGGLLTPFHSLEFTQNNYMLFWGCTAGSEVQGELLLDSNPHCWPPAATTSTAAASPHLHATISPSYPLSPRLSAGHL